MAKYYCGQKKKVLVVEPNELLRAQTAEKLVVIDYGITVTSIDRLYVDGPWHEVIIINEYDHIVNQSPYFVQPQVINGLWQFRGHKVIAFTATSSVSYERLVHHCICPPTVLKFKSEFELVHGTAPVADPTIVSCVSNDSLFASLVTDIDKHFELHPIIIIADASYRERLLLHLKDSKMKHAEGG